MSDEIGEVTGKHRRLSDMLENSEFRACPRFHWHELSEEQVEEIAERAALKAVEKTEARMYQAVGKGVVSKIYWIVGVSAVAVYIYLVKHGIISQ